MAGLLAATWVLAQLRAPLVEDALFWWVPKALLALETGPQMVLAHALPEAVEAGLTPETTPPQWAGGLPDYAHPPLWYGWLALWLRASRTVIAVHLACLLPAVLAAVGFAELGARLGHRWSGLAALCLPPVLAQMLRPELDLPLLAVVPWALVALLRGDWRLFGVLGLLAPWLKEPGVLLVAPAVVFALQERRWRWPVLAPLAGLGLLALAHGGLARPESLPAGAGAWLRDLPVAARIFALEQGRWLLLLGLPWAWRRLRPGGAAIGSLVVVWLVFFSLVGFFATRGLDPHTHVRYFVPGMAVGAVIAAARWPGLALPGLLFLRAASPFGPEASCFGIDSGRAERQAAPWIAEALTAGETVWVGSYQAAGLTQPWAGITPEPLRGFSIYAVDTDPQAPAPGDIIVEAAYGEPITPLERALVWDEAQRWQVGAATVRAWRVRARREIP